MTPGQRAVIDERKRRLPPAERRRREAAAEVQLLAALKAGKLRFQWRWKNEAKWRDGDPGFWCGIRHLDEVKPGCTFRFEEDDIEKLWPWEDC